VDLDTIGKALTIVGGIVALGSAARAWYLNPSRQDRIKTDLEILKLLPEDSEERDLVERHVEASIRDEYGGLARVRAAEIIRIFVRLAIAVALGYWAWGLFLERSWTWGAAACLVALALVAYSYIMYKILPVD
jgi:hypothetical protein